MGLNPQKTSSTNLQNSFPVSGSYIAQGLASALFGVGYLSKETVSLYQCQRPLNDEFNWHFLVPIACPKSQRSIQAYSAHDGPTFA